MKVFAAGAFVAATLTVTLVQVTSGPGRAVRPDITEAGSRLLGAAVPLWEAEHAKMEAAVGADVWSATRDGLRAIRRSLKAGEA